MYIYLSVCVCVSAWNRKSIKRWHKLHIGLALFTQRSMRKRKKYTETYTFGERESGIDGGKGRRRMGTTHLKGTTRKNYAGGEKRNADGKLSGVIRVCNGEEESFVRQVYFLDSVPGHGLFDIFIVYSKNDLRYGMLEQVFLHT